MRIHGFAYLFVRIVNYIKFDTMIVLRGEKNEKSSGNRWSRIDC